MYKRQEIWREEKGKVVKETVPIDQEYIESHDYFLQEKVKKFWEFNEKDIVYSQLIEEWERAKGEGDKECQPLGEEVTEALGSY